MSKSPIAAGYDLAAGQFPAELSAESDSRVALEKWASALPRRGRVLDVGCGAGRASRWLEAEGFAVTSLDLSREMLKRTLAGRPGALAAQADMHTLPAASAAFDGLTAFFSVTHIPKAEAPQVFREFRRVVRAGGALLVALVVGEADQEEQTEWAGGQVMHFSGFVEPELRGLFEAHGFGVFGMHSGAAQFHGQDEKHIYMFGRHT
jgi:ubiquinone/menaquinone biosynthesis C-methylase UbiE